MATTVTATISTFFYNASFSASPSSLLKLPFLSRSSGYDPLKEVLLILRAADHNTLQNSLLLSRAAGHNTLKEILAPFQGCRTQYPQKGFLNQVKGFILMVITATNPLCE